MEKCYNILSIEDNESDFYLIKNALDKISQTNFNLKNIQNGQDAIDFLYDKNTFFPDLILLDLNLPKIDGKELLYTIKNDDALKRIPIIIISNIQDEDIIKDTYNEHANAYIIKSFNVKTLFKKIKILSNFWLYSAEIPK